MMMKKSLAWLLALVLALSLLPALSGGARAVSPMPNFKLSADGKISWSHPGGVKVYYLHGLTDNSSVAIKNESWTAYDSKTWTDTGVVFDLRKYMDACGSFEEKTYQVTLSDQLNYDDPIHYQSAFTFDYHSAIPKLAAPQNLRWEGTTLRWDPVPNAGYYEVGVYMKPSSHAVWREHPDAATSVDLTKRSNWSDDLPVTFQPDRDYYFQVGAYPLKPGTYRESDTAVSETVTGAAVLGGYKTGDAYKVYVDGGYAKPSAAKPGETVTLTYTGMHGSHGSIVELETKEFDHWVVTKGAAALADPGSSTTTFVMAAGSGDVYVNAVTRSKLCAVAFDPNGGGGTMTAVAHMKGTAYTVPSCAFTPPAGQVFAGWQIAGGGGTLQPGESLTPDKDVTLLALWTAAPADPEPDPNPFVDISPSDYYYSPILWAYYSSPQVTMGVDDTHFGPKQTVTRGQCVTFLWRAMGQPEPTATKNPFVDVSESVYWYKAILWAVEKGITVGTDATHFSPGLTLSTHHIVTFLYRTLNPGMGGPNGGWDGAAEAWARQNDPFHTGLPFGVDIPVSDGTPCPRADVVTFLFEALGK